MDWSRDFVGEFDGRQVMAVESDTTCNQRVNSRGRILGRLLHDTYHFQDTIFPAPCRAEIQDTGDFLI